MLTFKLSIIIKYNNLSWPLYWWTLHYINRKPLIRMKAYHLPWKWSHLFSPSPKKFVSKSVDPPKPIICFINNISFILRQRRIESVMIWSWVFKRGSFFKSRRRCKMRGLTIGVHRADDIWPSHAKVSPPLPLTTTLGPRDRCEAAAASRVRAEGTYGDYKRKTSNNRGRNKTPAPGGTSQSYIGGFVMLVGLFRSWSFAPIYMPVDPLMKNYTAPAGREDNPKLKSYMPPVLSW